MQFYQKFRYIENIYYVNLIISLWYKEKQFLIDLIC